MYHNQAGFITEIQCQFNIQKSMSFTKLTLKKGQSYSNLKIQQLFLIKKKKKIFSKLEIHLPQCDKGH